MSKGTKFIEQLVRLLQKDQERKTDMQQQEKIINKPQSLIPFQKLRKQLSVKKKDKNFFQRICRLSPSLESRHIFKLFGFLGINQKALQNPDFSQSLLYSYLQSRVIQRIEYYDKAIILEMAEPAIPNYQPPADYIIEKFKSKGDVKFYQLSCKIQQLLQLLKKIWNKPPVQQKIESITNFFEFMGDQMYVCNFGSRKFSISKSLLTYLEYDLDQFSIQAIKYQSNFIEFFSAINYDIMLKHFLNCLKYLAKYSLQEISQSQLKQLTTYTYDGFIQSKNHVRTYCNMTISFINPTTGCHKINFIYYKQGARNIKKKADNKIISAIQEEKQRIRQAQYTILDKLEVVPKHLIEKNQKLFASYKEQKIKVEKKQ